MKKKLVSKNFFKAFAHHLSKPSWLIGIALLIGFATYLRYSGNFLGKSDAIGDTLIIGTNAEYPPFSFKSNDMIVGFDIDVVQEVVKRLGKKMVLKDMPFDTLLPKLQLGDLHMLAAGMTMTPQRAQRVNFTKPYLVDDPLLIITLNRPLPIKLLSQLEGKVVVVNEGYTADIYLSAIEGLKLLRLATPTDAFLALKAGRAEAFVAARSSVQRFFELHDASAFTVWPVEGMYDNYALALSKKYPLLLPEVQRVLDWMESDGTLALLKKKWSVA